MSTLTVEQWIESRYDEVAIAGAFFNFMVEELAANAHKGDRPGWLTMTEAEAIGEIMYHTAKLTYALRQRRQGDGPLAKVREFAADVANMAMMTADIAGCFDLSDSFLAVPPSVTMLREAQGPMVWEGDQA